MISKSFPSFPGAELHEERADRQDGKRDDEDDEREGEVHDGLEVHEAASSEGVQASRPSDLYGRQRLVIAPMDKNAGPFCLTQDHEGLPVLLLTPPRSSVGADGANRRPNRVIGAAAAP
jgi:hypothetical protein